MDVTVIASTSSCTCSIFRHVHWALRDKQVARPTKVRSQGMKVDRGHEGTQETRMTPRFQPVLKLAGK